MTRVSFLLVAAASSRCTSVGRSTAVAGAAAGRMRDPTTGAVRRGGSRCWGRASSGAVVTGSPALGLNAGHGSILVAPDDGGITLGGESSGWGDVRWPGALSRWEPAPSGLAPPWRTGPRAAR